MGKPPRSRITKVVLDSSLRYKKRTRKTLGPLFWANSGSETQILEKRGKNLEKRKSAGKQRLPAKVESLSLQKRGKNEKIRKVKNELQKASPRGPENAYS